MLRVVVDVLVVRAVVDVLVVRDDVELCGKLSCRRDIGNLETTESEFMIRGS